MDFDRHLERRWAKAKTLAETDIEELRKQILHFTKVLNETPPLLLETDIEVLRKKAMQLIDAVDAKMEQTIKDFKAYMEQYDKQHNRGEDPNQI